MAKRERNENYGKAQRTDQGYKDVVIAIKNLTQEVSLLREAYESEIQSKKSKAALNNISKYGSNVRPNITSIYPKKVT